MSDYSRVLTSKIKKSGMSLSEISRKASELGTPITVSYLSKLKNDRMPAPSPKISVVIARALNAHWYEFIAAGLSDRKQKDLEEILEIMYENYPDENASEIFSQASELVRNPENIIGSIALDQMSNDEKKKFYTDKNK